VYVPKHVWDGSSRTPLISRDSGPAQTAVVDENGNEVELLFNRLLKEVQIPGMCHVAINHSH